MAGYSGPCEIACPGTAYVSAHASLTDDGGGGGWLGRLTCADVDWFAAKLAGSQIAVRLPTGKIGTVVVARFTPLLPRQATVTGVGPPPW
jgi:hypothetical protein